MVAEEKGKGEEKMDEKEKIGGRKMNGEGYILLERTRALYSLLQPFLLLFPKDAKIVLRVEIEKGVIEGIKLLVKKNYKETNEERRKLILDYLGEINAVKMLIKQCLVLKYLSFGAYEKISPLIEEILSMATSQYKNLRESK
ncbi:hypothetical protein K9L16_02395 [Candidatus Pacearchaeota archaeon]|nr:hypothetical protein [Candidatus Pacearchaeota archaeon]